ncbi:MAG: 3-hydroxyacyl-CoA dehydrogenase family protein [Alphaproteobacteria bacterium]
MSRQIKSVAICGTGTMGSGIAALCANMGLPVLFLDLPSNGEDRNAISAAALERMQAGRQPMLKDEDALARVQIGNFDDDLSRIADYDLIVEAIIEDLGVKREFLEKVESLRSDGSIVATNTSGIMLAKITEGLGDRLARDIAVTHFFNPVLVMKLVELIPGENSDNEVIDCLSSFLADNLGKGVVLAKDTVNFIANRIGCFWLLNGLNSTGTALEAGCTIEEIDAALSKPIGVPPTGLFGLWDLIGLDVMDLVAANLRDNLPAGDVGLAYAKLPQVAQDMLARGQIGRKAGAGFYRMSKTGDGERFKETFDVAAGDWRGSADVEMPDDLLNAAGLLFDDGPLGKLAWQVMCGTLLYAADLVPQISDDVVNIDNAIRWGFGWHQGPFELLDALGPERIIDRLEAEGRPVPKMLQVIRGAGGNSFYRKNGAEYLGLDGAWHSV